MTKERKNTGVIAEFRTTSDDSSDTNISSISIEGEQNAKHLKKENPPNMKQKRINTSSEEFYVMRPKTIKGPNGRPCKIEFQKVNNQINRKMNMNANCSYANELCNCQNHSQMGSMPPINNYKDQIDYGVQNNINDFKSNSVFIDMPPEESKTRGKIGKVFSCFDSGAVSDNSSSNDENDKAPQNNDKHDEKTEYYRFDHGDHNCYYTTDKAPILTADEANEKVRNRATKFWAEFFGSVNVVVSFVLVFFIQLYRFILYSIIRSTIVEFLQTTSDYCLKPTYAVLFNGYIQPTLLFLRNIFESVWDTVEPITQMFLGFCIPIIECLRSIRLIDLKYKTNRNHKEANRQENHV